MNTSSWGPKAWIYTHTVANNYDPVKNRQSHKKFFTALKDILPCKYCRMSYKDFIKELPIEPFLDNQVDLAYWYYLIHDKVNDKLRNQGLLFRGNPSFKCIYNKYSRILDSINVKKHEKDINQASNMWYFLYTIAFNYDPKLHNAEDYIKFFDLVGETMPYDWIKDEFQSLLKKKPINLSSQEALTKWLYCIQKKIHKGLEKKGYYEKLNMPSYKAIKNKYEAIRSDCNKKKEIPGTLATCQIPNSVERCQAKTLRGRQCIKKHVEGFPYCSQHMNIWGELLP